MAAVFALRHSFLKNFKGLASQDRTGEGNSDAAARRPSLPRLLGRSRADASEATAGMNAALSHVDEELPEEGGASVAAFHLRMTSELITQDHTGQRLHLSLASATMARCDKLLKEQFQALDEAEAVGQTLTEAAVQERTRAPSGITSEALGSVSALSPHAPQRGVAAPLPALQAPHQAIYTKGDLALPARGRLVPASTPAADKWEAPADVAAAVDSAAALAAAAETTPQTSERGDETQTSPIQRAAPVLHAPPAWYADADVSGAAQQQMTQHAQELQDAEFSPALTRKQRRKAAQAKHRQHGAARSPAPTTKPALPQQTQEPSQTHPQSTQPPALAQRVLREVIQAHPGKEGKQPLSAQVVGVPSKTRVLVRFTDSAGWITLQGVVSLPDTSAVQVGAPVHVLATDVRPSDQGKSGDEWVVQCAPVPSPARRAHSSTLPPPAAAVPSKTTPQAQAVPANSASKPAPVRGKRTFNPHAAEWVPSPAQHPMPPPSPSLVAGMSWAAQQQAALSYSFMMHQAHMAHMARVAGMPSAAAAATVPATQAKVADAE